jgi:hypothetical protein
MSAEAARGYALGERVRIIDLGQPGHVRTPHYARNKVGVIDYCCGIFDNPENRAYGRVGRERIPLYRVRLKQSELWPDYEGPEDDSLVLEIYHHWLQPA